MNFDPHDLEWQRRYERNDTPWDKGAPAPPLVAYLRENQVQGRVLVPGCGRGHDVRLLGMQEGVTVTGLDLSPAAVAQARELSTGSSNIDFTTGDFFALPKDLQGAFDWVVEHTCFCAIEPRQRTDYVKAAALALRPGGKILAIFYLDPSSETAPPFRISKGELSRLFDPPFQLLDEWIPSESFPGREGRELVRILQKR